VTHSTLEPPPAGQMPGVLDRKATLPLATVCATLVAAIYSASRASGTDFDYLGQVTSLRRRTP
jgi:hypothetical protein